MERYQLARAHASAGASEREGSAAATHAAPALYPDSMRKSDGDGHVRIPQCVGCARAHQRPT